MVFISFNFLFFFTVIFVTHQVTAQRFKWLVLLFSSYYFYGYANLNYLPLLIVPTIIVYIFSIKIDKETDEKTKQRYFWFGIVSASSGLIFFKYFNFIGSSIIQIGKIFNNKLFFSPLDLLWPLGISFYSFKLLSYLIDIYKGNSKAEPHFGYFALYVASFPQLLAGPIDRASKFIPELKKKVPIEIDQIIQGLQQIILGIFKKTVISDRLAIYVNEIFGNPSEHHGIIIIFAAYFYTFQIYCDFSGYSDMAIGLSKMLGYKSMKNFDFPYLSKNLTEFWNKWHISLSTWLRDYIFLPIAYLILRIIKTPKLLYIKVETWAYIIGMFLTMLIGGLWHGPKWTMVIWGGLHGFYLTFGYMTKKKRKKLYKKLYFNNIPKIKHFFSVLFTFHLITIAWVFFRAEDFSNALSIFNNISFSFSNIKLGYLFFNILLILIFFSSEYIANKKTTFLNNLNPFIKTFAYALFICIIMILSVDTSNEFIYFKF